LGEDGLVGRRCHHQGGILDAALRCHLARQSHQGHRIQITAAPHGVAHDAAHDASASAPSATTAARKQANGARTTPAPTWPTPGFLCAMPVLMIGAMPVSTTSRTSMPVATPAKLRAGIVQRGFSLMVISRIIWVKCWASAAEPAPTKPTTAGAAAMAKPPRPMLSTIAESPMSGLASSAEKPGK